MKGQSPVVEPSRPQAASRLATPADSPRAIAHGELIAEYQHGYHYPDESVFKTKKGLNEDIVNAISHRKEEPEWMRQFRLRSLAAFRKKPMPNWGADLSALDFENLTYYAKPQEGQSRTWDDVPENIKKTFERIGIPEAERKFLAGVGAQYDSEVVYHSIKEELSKQGVIFTDPETAVREHPDLVKRYFGTVIPFLDNKFAALNSAVWSGGSFVYVPKGVKVEVPLQAYFRINARSFGQFERTLIIADEGSFVHYIEGCTAPVYATESLHSAVVEIIALEGARVRYTTIQNWSNDVYNLVTKRAVAHKDAVVEWVDGNIGAKRTMKYPSIWLMGEGAHGEVLSIAFAGKGQEQDTGAKAVHAASHTSSVVTAKSISRGGGISSYRGLLKVNEGLHDVRSRVVCDALILDEQSRSNTYPYMEIDSDDVSIEHEARVSRISEDQLFYLMSRGMSEQEASLMIVSGFLDPLVKQLPMEYAVELNRLIELEMEGNRRMISTIVEPLWLRALRAGAHERAESFGWPTTSEEEWRRTDLSRLDLSSYAPAETPKPACPREADPGQWAGVIRFEATRCTEVALGAEAQEKGARLIPLDLALEEFEAPLAKLLHDQIEKADNKFLNLHYAALSHGAFLWIPAGVEIAAPFLIELTEQGGHVSSAPHVQIVLGQGAKASVVHRVAGAGTTAAPAPADLLCNAVVDMRVADAASLSFCEVQQLGSSALYFRYSRAEIGRDASLRHFDAQFGARLAKTRVDCALAGEGAEAVLNGVYYCAKGQHMDLRTVQNHVSPKANSRAYYKGAVAGGGRTVFQGLIEVAPEASGTDAFLTNRNLVLGEAARSDSIPTLRIGNNDVKCSHGSTTGRLSSDELFYLESRGLSPVDAREMLVIGYFEDLLTPTPESFREDALACIRDRLRGAA